MAYVVLNFEQFWHKTGTQRPGRFFVEVLFNDGSSETTSLSVSTAEILFSLINNIEVDKSSDCSACGRELTIELSGIWVIDYKYGVEVFFITVKN